MNRLTFFFSFLLLIPFLSPSPINAEPCERGNTQNSTYMFRQQDKRCEGINTQPVAASFSLNSFTIGQLTPAKNLTLTIPKIPNLGQPKVKIQSLEKYYQLDPLELKDKGTQWQFQWSNQVIQQENIPPQTLRSLASVNNTIIPVILNQSPAYQIGVYTGGNAIEITLRIKQNNKIIYEQTLKNQQGKEVMFQWNGRDKNQKKLPKGRYQLEIKATVEQPNAPITPRSFIREFEHNPSWLN